MVKRVPQRRRRSVEEKRRSVEETLEPGASVARVARAHGVNANQVFVRRQHRQGLLEEANKEALGLLPVRVVKGAAASGAARQRSVRTGPTATGMMHIELPKGRLRLTGCVDAEALRVVLEKLLG